MFLFDPLGTHVIEDVKEDAKEENKEEAKPGETPKAATTAQHPVLQPKRIGNTDNGRAYVYLNTDVPTRFPDMFKPFEELPFGFNFNKPFPGTLIRCPLRKKASPLSQNVYTKEVMQDVFTQMQPVQSSNLIFCRSLESFAVSVWQKNVRAPQQLFTTFLQASNDLKATRRKLITNTEWKKSGMLSFLKGAQSAMRTSYQILITSVDQTQPATRDLW